MNISRAELILKIKEDKQIDFIAQIMTPWNLLCLKAYLNFLRKELKRDVEGIVLISKHIENDYLLDTDKLGLERYARTTAFYYTERTNTNITELVFELFSTKRYKADGHTLYVIAPTEPWLFFTAECLREFCSDVRTIVLDDGIGSAYGVMQWFQNMIRTSASMKVGIMYLLRKMLYLLIKIFYNIKITNFGIFLKNAIEKEIVLTNFKEVLSEDKSIDAEINICPESDNYIVYFTQPFKDINLIEQMDKILLEVMHELKKQGYKIVVKKHPRETSSKLLDDLDVIYLPKEYSIEQIFSTVTKKPKYVLGWTTTALFTSALFWDIPSYTLCDMLLEVYEDKEMKTFYKIFNKYSKKFSNLGAVKALLREEL